MQPAVHFDALRCVREFGEIRVWSPTPEHLASFVDRRPGARAARTAEEAVRAADVAVVATSSVTPAIASEGVGDGAHVIAIGACRPSQRELDPELVARAALVVDSHRAGDPRRTVHGSAHSRRIGEIAGGSRPGRRWGDEVTLFKSLGLAVEDVVAAGLAYRRARERNLGPRLPA